MNDAAGKKSRIPLVTAYLYVILPFLIFAIGWMGKRFWIPIIILLALCYIKMCKEAEPLWHPEWNRDNIVKCIFLLIIICVWVYFSGIGKYVFQNTDHSSRNAIFEILVSYDWPIINYDLSDTNIALGGNATSLVYYIGFWLPAAVVGKIAGINAGYAFQYIWAVLGIGLLYYLFLIYKKKVMIWPLVVFIFFSGLDIVGTYLMGTKLSDISPSQHLEWWSTSYQYSSMTTQLFWVFNQAIPAWLITFLLYIQKNNKNMIILWACCMLSSTFSFLGLLPFLLFWIFTKKYTFTERSTKKEIIKKKFFAWLKDICSFQNIVGGGIIGIFSFLYLSSNLSGNMINSAINNPNLEGHPVKYIAFIFFEVGIYVILIYKRNSNRFLYYVILGTLLIIPLIRVGTSADFCMRASIPALFLLMIMVIDTLEQSFKEKGILISLIVTLTIGAITPLHEFVRTTQETVTRFNASQQIYEISQDRIKILNAPNFSGIIDNSFFFQHIAR